MTTKGDAEETIGPTISESSYGPGHWESADLSTSRRTALGSATFKPPGGVDGWTYGNAVPAPDVSTRESKVWFRLADGAGWVPFASVRAYPTGYDPTGEVPAVVQAAAPASCELQ